MERMMERMMPRKLERMMPRMMERMECMGAYGSVWDFVWSGKEDGRKKRIEYGSTGVRR